MGRNEHNYRGKNCVVTGGSGFIGQNIVNRLIADGANVYVVDNFSYGAKRESVNKSAKVIVGDVRDPQIYTNLPDIKIDYLFHFAAPSSITLFNRNRTECVDITVTGFLNAARFCAENNTRLVYPSSGSVYAGSDCPQSEATQLSLDSLNSYAQAKLSLEYIRNAFGDSLNALGLRIFAGYGPSETHKGDFASVVYMFCKQMFNGEEPVIFGDGQQKRDFVYIDDAAEAILTLGEKAIEPVVNIGSGKSVSFNNIIEIINEVSNKNIKAKHIEKPNIYLEETLADNILMKKYCTRLEFTSIREGVSKILEDLKRSAK